MWPVAPKMSHTRGFGGFEGPGGSVVEGSWSLGSRVDVVADAVGETADPGFLVWLWGEV